MSTCICIVGANFVTLCFYALFCRRYAKMTGQKYERLIEDMDRDNFMSAQEALEYGLIDRVIDTASA
jgi:ATP-dependent protease ClpP protease subunit